MTANRGENPTIYDVLGLPSPYNRTDQGRAVGYFVLNSWRPRHKPIFHNQAQANVGQRGLAKHLRIVYSGAQKHSERGGAHAVYDAIWNIDGFLQDCLKRGETLDLATSYNFGGMKRSLDDLAKTNADVVTSVLAEHLLDEESMSRNSWLKASDPDRVEPVAHYEDEVRSLDPESFYVLFKRVKECEYDQAARWGKALWAVRANPFVLKMLEAIENENYDRKKAA